MAHELRPSWLPASTFISHLAVLRPSHAWHSQLASSHLQVLAYTRTCILAQKPHSDERHSTVVFVQTQLLVCLITVQSASSLQYCAAEWFPQSGDCGMLPYALGRESFQPGDQTHDTAQTVVGQ